MRRRENERGRKKKWKDSIPFMHSNEESEIVVERSRRAKKSNKVKSDDVALRTTKIKGGKRMKFEYFSPRFSVLGRFDVPVVG